MMDRFTMWRRLKNQFGSPFFPPSGNTQKKPHFVESMFSILNQNSNWVPLFPVSGCYNRKENGVESVPPIFNFSALK